MKRLCSALTLLLTVQMQAAEPPPSDRVVFDFSRPPVGAWQIINDGVMGGVSTSRFELTSNLTAVFEGVVSLENNGGFASVRSPQPTMNLTGCNALVLRARGDGKRYKLTVRQDASWQSPIYQCAFSTRAGEWQEHCLQLGEFTPSFRGRTLTDAPPVDPDRVVSIGFLISDKQDGAFRLEIDWIKARIPAGSKTTK